MDGGGAVLYDVRSEDSYQTQHAVGSLSLPEEQVEGRLGSIPRDKVLIFYCT
jgi:rhodanese-related sulfurtransferase